MAHMPLRAVLTCLAALLCSSITAICTAQERQNPEKPEAVDVYLLAGQSNMVGQGQVAQLSDDWRQPNEHARFWNGKSFEVFSPGQPEPPARANRFGPETGFVRTITTLQPGRTIYIIKFALGGQPLHAGWDGNKWTGENPGPNRATFYPGEQPGDPNTGNHYQSMIRHAQAAFESLREQGKEPTLRGVAWMQGEHDSKNAVSATQYARSLTLLKKRIEEDLDSPPVALVFGQVLPHEPALNRFTHRTEIRQAMANADMRSGSDEAIPGCLMVPTEGMPLHGDTVHYNTTGQLMLGQAMGLAMLQAQHMNEQTAASKESPR